MWKLLKNFFNVKNNLQPSATPPSIHKLVNDNSLNKRKNFRVKYPHVGATHPYPKIYFKENELNVCNISIGGVLILDDTESLGQTVGDVVTLTLTWKDFSCKIRSRIVAATLHRRHLQFEDINPKAFSKIVSLINPGYVGAGYHRVVDKSGLLDVSELWVSKNNDTLLFTKNNLIAELTYNHKKIIFENQLIYFADGDKRNFPKSLLPEIIVTLANFSQPSEKVLRLIETMDSASQTVLRPRKTGTDG